MARSEEAILRRALKRQRTEEEQRKADRKDMEQSKLRKAREEEQAKRSSARKKEFKKSLMKGTPFLANAERAAATERKPETRTATSTTTTSTTRTSKDTDRPKAPHPNIETDDRMKEDGAWMCPSCGNENFASRNWCNSKTCNERRPGNIQSPPPFSKQRVKTPSENYRQRSLMTEPGAWDCPSCGFQNYSSRDVCFSRSCRQSRPGSDGSRNHFDNKKSSSTSSSNSKRKRHDPETSKQLVWSKQADATTLSKNQELRERYRATGGEGMTEEEIDRAKILIAREERKKQKKKVSTVGSSAEETATNDKKESLEQNEGVNNEASTNPSESSPPSNKPKKEKDAKRKSKSQKDKNKVLLERYKETKGQGMKEEEVERAKTLLARAERKQQKRAKAAEQGKTQAKDNKLDPQ